MTPRDTEMIKVLKPFGVQVIDITWRPDYMFVINRRWDEAQDGAVIATVKTLFRHYHCGAMVMERGICFYYVPKYFPDAP